MIFYVFAIPKHQNQINVKMGTQFFLFANMIKFTLNFYDTHESETYVIIKCISRYSDLTKTLLMSSTLPNQTPGSSQQLVVSTASGKNRVLPTAPATVSGIEFTSKCWIDICVQLKFYKRKRRRLLRVHTSPSRSLWDCEWYKYSLFPIEISWKTDKILF